MPITPNSTILAEDFINESEKDPTPANDEGRVPKLEADGKLSQEWLELKQEYPTYEAIDGTTTPVPVLLASDGSVLKSEADVANRAYFNGFVVGDASGQLPAAYLSGATQENTASFSFTANAGTDRVLIVQVNYISSITDATGVTWNGVPMTRLATQTSGVTRVTLWHLAIGDAGTNETYTIAITGGSTPRTAYMTTYQYVDQTTPIQVYDADAVTTTPVTSSITPTQGYSLVLQAIAGEATVTGDSQLTVRHQTYAPQKYYDGYIPNTLATSFSATLAASNDVAQVVAALKNANSTQVKMYYGFVLDGFTGLTIGAKYYVSNIQGTISVTPGSTTVLVGKALSATRLVIVSQ